MSMTPEREEAWRREMGELGIETIAFDDFGPSDVDVFGFERESSKRALREWLERRFDGELPFSITTRCLRADEVAQVVREVWASNGRETRWNSQCTSLARPVYDARQRLVGFAGKGFAHRFWTTEWENDERERLEEKLSVLDREELELHELRKLIDALPSRLR